MEVIIKRFAYFTVGVLVVVTPALAFQSDAQIRQRMIRESISSYPSSCPCPYNTDRAGRSCGRRSAYSRPGGYAPICYARDVSDAQVREWRLAHRWHFL